MTSFTNVTDANPLQLSDAITSAGFGTGTKLAHWTVIFVGHWMNGTVLSNTVIVCEHVAEFPHSSVALYVLVTLNRLTHV